MSLTEQQQQAAHAEASVAVTAGAGTGKTHMLAERYLFHLRQGYRPLEIVAATFTEKAASELRSRIRALVAQQLPQRSDLLAELEAAQITTLHAIAARVCREHPTAASVPFSFGMLDEIDSQLWQAEQLAIALDRLPLELYAQIPHSQMAEALQAMLDDPIAAEYALKHDCSTWADLAAQIRQNALMELRHHSVWRSAKSTLNAHEGAAGDSLENNRRLAVGAIESIEQSSQIEFSLQTIRDLNLRSKGSAKNWQAGPQAFVQESLKALKTLVQKTLERQLITLQLGEADDRLSICLSALRQAFQLVQNFLNAAKQRRRILTFADLEVGALKALRNPQVRDYYARRWKVFLIDEFQDTNPVQAELLQISTAATYLTIVGDVKQSIYGFRRADVEVFQQFRDRIVSGDGLAVGLAQSFRTHHGLIGQVNQIFAPVLANLHQNLTAHRQQVPHLAPHLRVFAIQAEPAINKPQRQQAEALHIAQTLRQMLDRGTMIHDKASDRLRPVEYRDIAILSRTREPLALYGETLQALGIPAVETGGGDLLATRTAKDGLALLRFLADPKDDLALIAVLRSPFFAISDRLLFEVMQAERTSNAVWWQRIRSSHAPELAFPIRVFSQLLGDRQAESPSRLLQIADRLTGYTAVITNLSGGDRRLADWRGLRELVGKLERRNLDLFGVVRQCKQLVQAAIEVPRPTLEAQAVALMTIHAAKGLEWPIVVVPDLTRAAASDSPAIYFDPKVGVALKALETEDSQPVLYRHLKQLRQQREAAEAKRVLYVALTRARDHLLLTAADSTGGGLEILRPGLAVAGIEIVAVPFSAEAALPVLPPDPLPPAQPTQLLLGAIAPGLSDLPVTALSDYALCPKRFQFRYVDGHPGAGEGSSAARRVGTLTHKALELDIRDPIALAQFDPTAAQLLVDEAIALAKRFDQAAAFAALRSTAIEREQSISWKIGKLRLRGIVDLVGTDWILDFKTDRIVAPAHHRFQLWAYARALNRSTAHIAYLRHDRLHSWTAADLEKVGLASEAIVQGIISGRYPANPTPISCQGCPYGEVCQHQVGSG
ncbi:UvrD-helicase domain-containing protein [Microcoleus sp. FACHB-1515]|uniref:UvrD-helicase domain-containing protein n=1 Tax=Cyanophyceae TaxID=3028117 RepID=UPI001686BF18|nr:UvrD-helicase domain-containing protein [Microcoleus sp. FACHB-1515]MBD2093299.1 UvrD-helicase domain-containing protein [Microcoleus sp. FACHB-1515]